MQTVKMACGRNSGRGRSSAIRRGAAFLLAFAGAAVLAAPSDKPEPSPAAAAPAAFSVLNARGRGTFNIGPAAGKVIVAADPDLKKDVLKFDFTVPAGNLVGVWTKDYPAGLTSAAVNTVAIGVKAPAGVPPVSVSLEIKGAKDVQRIPLAVQAGWSRTVKTVEWSWIGDLREAVFVVTSAPGQGAAGTLLFDLEFTQARAAGKSAGAGGVDSTARAPQRGAFNIGPAEGKSAVVFDEATGKDLVQFDYAAPPGTIVGVWTKGYPPALGPAKANAVKIAVRLTDPAQARRIATSVEIKGAKETQRLPLSLQPGRNVFKRPVDWKTIGALREVVFVLSPGAGRRETGTLLFDVEFAKLARPLKPAGALRLAEAPERGSFNIGAGKGDVTLGFDERLKKNVVRYNFTAGAKTLVGVWTKGYPADLGTARANAVKFAVKTPKNRVKDFSVTVELKGTKETQRIPVGLKAGWASGQKAVDWDLLGRLREVVFVVAPAGPGKKTSGSLSFDLEFVKAAADDIAVEGTGIGILSAAERGTFNIGPAEGKAAAVFEPAAKKEVVKFDYAAPRGTVAGVWTKGYPSALNAAAANAVNVAVKALDEAQARSVTVALELKGTADVQRIPLDLRAGWTTSEKPINWALLGELKEAVFTVSPAGEERAAGTLFFDLTFTQVGVGGAEVRPAGSFNVLDAAERGSFNIGPAEGNVVVAFDDSINRDLVRFDYIIPTGTVAGVWTKSYPPGLTPAAVNALNLRLHLPQAAQAVEITAAVEIKGAKDTQTINLPLQPGWNIRREPIDWSAVGALKEAVLVVKSAVADRTVSGALSFEWDFIQGPFAVKRGPSPAGKTGMVFLSGVLLFLAAAFVGKLFARRPPAALAAARPAPGPARDVLFAAAAVVAAGAALAMYARGAVPSAGTSFDFLFLGLAGAVLAELLTFALAGRHSTPAEIFTNFIFSGFLAATASPQALWQAPANGSQILLKSHLTAAVVFLLYHVANAAALSSAGKPLRAVGGALLVGTPYLFGWILTLQSDTFLQSLANGMTGGVFAGRVEAMEALGRLLVVFAFNETVANALGLLVKGKLLKSARGHLLLFAVSLAVVVSPAVADAGSAAAVAALPRAAGALAAVFAAMGAQAGLWAEVYLVTGMILDAIHGAAPTPASLHQQAGVGLRKGLAFSGLFLGVLYGIKLLLDAAPVREALAASPLLLGAVFGALAYPFAKAIVESFDGSMPFFRRAAYSYKNGVLYARGAVAGFALAWGLTHGWVPRATGDRLAFGLLMGALASAGVSLARDAAYALAHRGKIQTWKIYLVDGGLGGFIGAALAFYLDAAQVPVIVEKFHLYTTAGFSPKTYDVYALISKWGRVDLGSYTGGARLLLDEAMAGVITWTIAAWLFAVNRVFMAAYFQKDKQPIRHFFSAPGFRELGINTIHVLRWGLWMAPIINTGLRLMAQATWYNQDGAVRTLFAIVKNLTLNPADFQAWSLNVFVALLAYDLVRVLIWVDHMGLRVATLVNLSFLGMDRLDERLARFIGPAAAQRYIPEGVKRFTTWAPLLIPFYIPRGPAWDYAWETSQKMQKAAAEGGGFAATLRSLPPNSIALWVGAAFLLALAVAMIVRSRGRSSSRPKAAASLSNREYKVVVQESGESHSEFVNKGYDLSRRSYDGLHPAGRALFLVDTDRPAGDLSRSWPVLGNFPVDRFEPSRLERRPEALRVVNGAHGLKCAVEIRLPDKDAPAELWTVTLENLTDKPRVLRLVPYLEWVLDRPDADCGHTQYGRLFPEIEYVRGSNALLAWQKKTKIMGFIAAEAPPEGFSNSRMDFIGRARSLWSPRLLETLEFLDARDTPGYPTFDPIGSLLMNSALAPSETKTLRFLIGSAKDRASALELIQKFLQPHPPTASAPAAPKGGKVPLIGHGTIPAGTPQPYAEFTENGDRLAVHTPFTPRPFDHALSNDVGHYVMVTNRGLHTTSNGNSQQNPITPDWPDTVTREVPAEAVYLYDTDEKEWYAPTHHPLNDTRAKNTAEFGVDGTALFRMSRGTLSTEFTVFVPPREPLGVYLLTVKNKGPAVRRLRVAPFFQIVLAGAAEPRRQPLVVRHDRALDALTFENPVNAFRWGPAFAAMSLPADRVETRRGRFFGAGRGVDRPVLVERGEPDLTHPDDRPVAAFLGALEIPPGEERTVVVVLGQTDDQKKAAALVKKYKNVEAAQDSLEETRAWWLSLMGTVRAETSNPEFDRYMNWLKYQAVAERIWARRGFYQTSGAYGFRDQLQDSVNLAWVDPALARKQIVLHASQQFIEGDVVHWFHTLHDGRTAFSNRSHASDNLLWLPWAAAEYVRLTGDDSLLDEMASYLRSENPFLPLPHNKHGWGMIYPRSTRADTVYRHCLQSINLVLDKRMGAHGIPLIGTGDWNDGLDEIGSQGRGESVWLGFFLLYVLKNMFKIIEKRDGRERRDYYLKKSQELETALEKTWREDRYLRAIHDDGTEVGVKDSGVWEIDALTAAWAVMAGLNPERARTVFQTALRVLERDNVILLGWPALREDTKPYLGRSSHYPEGVRENGMYCHGAQWLVKAARTLAEQAEGDGNRAKAKEYRDAAYRLWMKIAPISHVTPKEVEIYGGQPNKQAADFLTTFDQGRMIWHGYTGAAGWMLRQAFEGVIGASLVGNEVVPPADLAEPRGALKVKKVVRNLSGSPLRPR